MLVSKGKKITNKAIQKLQRYENLQLKDLIVPANNRLNKQSKRLSKYTDHTIESFETRKNIRPSYNLERASEILGSIIFESKTKPWWIYVNSLGNYLDRLYTHSIDVAIISLIMAIELGYSSKELWNLGIGALLHDVGKLLIPKTILEKDEPLTDIEQAFIKQHCELGVSSLASFEFSEQYTDIVLQHHERIDGSGFPNGLKGDEISQNAKIVIVADVVDLITTYRAHNKPKNMNTAIRKLKIATDKYPQDLVDLLEKILEQ